MTEDKITFECHSPELRRIYFGKKRDELDGFKLRLKRDDPRINLFYEGRLVGRITTFILQGYKYPDHTFQRCSISPSYGELDIDCEVCTYESHKKYYGVAEGD